MSDIITNRFVTYEGLQDYDTLLKSWLPNIDYEIQRHGDRGDYYRSIQRIQAMSNGIDIMPVTTEESKSSLLWRLRNAYAGITAWKKTGGDDPESGATVNIATWAPAAILGFKSQSYSHDGTNASNKAFTLLTIPQIHSTATNDTKINNESFHYVISNDGSHGISYTLLDTRNINTPSLTGQTAISTDTNFKGTFPVSRINYMTVPKNSTSNNTTYGLWGSRYDDDGQTANGGYQAYTPRQLCDVSFNPKDQTLTVPIIDTGIRGFRFHTAGSDQGTSFDEYIPSDWNPRGKLDQASSCLSQLVIGKDGASSMSLDRIFSSDIHDSITVLGTDGFITALPNWTDGLLVRSSITLGGSLFAVDLNGNFYVAYLSGTSQTGTAQNPKRPWIKCRCVNKLAGDNDTINGQSITSIFETNSATVKKATNAAAVKTTYCGTSGVNAEWPVLLRNSTSTTESYTNPRFATKLTYNTQTETLTSSHISTTDVTSSEITSPKVTTTDSLTLNAGSDKSILFTINNTTKLTLTNNGNFTPSSAKSQNLGSETYPWGTIYASVFNGSQSKITFNSTALSNTINGTLAIPKGTGQPIHIGNASLLLTNKNGESTGFTLEGSSKGTLITGSADSALMLVTLSGRLQVAYYNSSSGKWATATLKETPDRSAATNKIKITDQNNNASDYLLKWNSTSGTLSFSLT